MNISPEDAKLFFDLMLSLQLYVGNKLNLLSGITSIKDYLAADIDTKHRVRDALYEHADMIDPFCSENPAKLSKDQLAMVSAWKRFVPGKFYIERYLAKHAIFIGNNDAVYAVKGLFDPLDNIFPRHILPTYVDTVLLPFKGQIVYDGLLRRHPVFFGGGIKSDLKEIYLRAKQNHRILETLDATPQVGISKPIATSSVDWTAKIESLAKEAQTLRASASAPAMQAPVFSLVKAALDLAGIAASDPEDADQLEKAVAKVERALKKVNATLDRIY